ncbi:MAG: hypothetical protein NZ455_13640 [Bacteroidia bacterium]|nr:hypothetical protein [Bacteroidia bacterium]MDW8347083.1 hypothetical protein [Bacteroidia bacterium]
MPKKLKNITKARIHKDLKNFDIQINEFGEVSHTLDIDELNNFLNRNVQDKKLLEHPEFMEMQQKLS